MPALFIREYIVVAGFIIIGTFVFYLFFKDRSFLTWGRLLFLVITAAYFSKSFFLFAFILFCLVRLFVPKKSIIEKISYYFLLLPLIPPGISQRIPFPGLEQLFTLTYPRVLNLFILLPIFTSLINRSQKGLFSRKLDKYVILYFLYIFTMGFRDTTFTNAFRGGFNWFIDIFILYFVISRTITETDDFEKIFKPMIFIASILALIAIFETVKGWHVYSSLMSDLGEISTGIAIYGRRLGLLRAFGSFGGPIPFGIYLATAMGFTVFLRHFSSGRNKVFFGLLIGLFFSAIFCTISRGPLVSIAIFFFLYVLLARQKALKLIPMFLALGFVLSFLPVTDITISTLPFIGEKAQKTISYRKMLWNNSIEVIKKSPLTGSNTYLEEPEMKELSKYGGKLKRGGIDLVNAYLQIALRYGTIGLAFFSLIYLTVLGSLWRAFFKATDKKTIILGKILFSVTLSLLIAIVTVSFISFIPFYFWILVGLSEGYKCAMSKKIYCKAEE